MHLCTRVHVRVFVSDAQYHSREGGRVFGLAVLSICLHPRPFPKEGGMALNCLVLHQLTKALPSRIREEQGLLRAVGKERERESRRK